MIVHAIKLHNVNHTYSSGCRNNNQTFSLQHNFDKYPISSKNQYVNFGSSNVQIISYPRVIEELLEHADKLPCPYCGKKLVSQRFYNSLKSISKRKTASSGDQSISFEAYTRKVVKKLKKVEDRLQPTERAVWEEMKAYYTSHPCVTLQEILINLLPQHLAKLSADQMKIFEQIDITATGLSKHLQKRVLSITSEARKLIIEDDPDNPFERKKVIAKFDMLKDKFSKKKGKFDKEKATINLIEQIALQLPTSSRDVDAFVVKYSRRNSVDIAQRLVDASVASIEHFKPQSAFQNNIYLASQPKNLGLCHKGCNGAKSNDRDYLKKHPEFIKYVREHINAIIKLINNGILRFCNCYPKAVQETLLKESSGVIDVNTSGLNL